MSKGEKRPSWFKLFLHQKPIIDSVPDDVVGKAVKAAFHYFATREETELDALAIVVYSSFKPYIEESFTDYERDVRNGHKGGRPQKPPVTTGKGGLPSLTQAEAEAEADAEADAEAEGEEEGEGEGDKADKPPKLAHISPPSVDDVRAYCSKQGYTTIDPERFVSYYAARQWIAGQTAITDWRAAVDSWHRKDMDKNGNGQSESKPLWTVGTVV